MTYSLSAERVDALTGALLRELPLDELPPGARFACTEIGPQSRYANVARHVERLVFEEAFNNGPEIMDREYGPYESNSRWWLLVDLKTRSSVGALRAIEDTREVGLKALADMSRPFPLGLHIAPERVYREYGAPSDKWWEASTVAVTKPYRGPSHGWVPSTLLYRELYKRSVENRVDHLVAIIDENADRNIALLGLPFVPVLGSGSFSYMDSEVSRYLHTKVTAIEPAMRKRAEQLAGTRGHFSRFVRGLVLSVVDGVGRDELYLPLDCTGIQSAD